MFGLDQADVTGVKLIEILQKPEVDMDDLR